MRRAVSALLLSICCSSAALCQTTFYLRNDDSDIVIGTDYTRLLDPTRGLTSITITTNAVAGPVTPPTAATQLGIGAHKLTWVSAPLKAFTLSGDVVMNLRSRETSGLANAAVEMRVMRLDNAGAFVSDVVAVPPASIPAELGTTDAAVQVTATPTSTDFVDGDRLGVQIYMDDADGVTMSNVGSPQLRTTFNGPTAGAEGDAYLTIAETLVYECSCCFYGPWPPGPKSDCKKCSRSGPWPPGPSPIQ